MNREHLPKRFPVKLHFSDLPLPDHRCNGIRDIHTWPILLILPWFIQLLRICSILNCRCSFLWNLFFEAILYTPVRILPVRAQITQSQLTGWNHPAHVGIHGNIRFEVEIFHHAPHSFAVLAPAPWPAPLILAKTCFSDIPRKKWPSYSCFGSLSRVRMG